MLRDPGRYKRVGARLPAGVLLVGPPGTGKTLLARVAAAEAGVPFYACSASDFVEVFVGRGPPLSPTSLPHPFVKVFVGRGPARVRKLFKQVRSRRGGVVWRGVVWRGVVWCGVAWRGVVCSPLGAGEGVAPGRHHALMFLTPAPSCRVSCVVCCVLHARCRKTYKLRNTIFKCVIRVNTHAFVVEHPFFYPIPNLMQVAAGQVIAHLKIMLPS